MAFAQHEWVVQQRQLFAHLEVDARVRDYVRGRIDGKTDENAGAGRGMFFTARATRRL
jgi:hypothetical protein